MSLGHNGNSKKAVNGYALSGGINLLFSLLPLFRCSTCIVDFGGNFYSDCISFGIGHRREYPSRENRGVFLSAQSALHSCLRDRKGVENSPCCTKQSEHPLFQWLVTRGADVCVG